MDLNRFFNDLASQKPVPGGGSASCVAAAMAVALMEMVARLSAGREDNPGDINKQLQEILGYLGVIKARLFNLAEEDAKGYRKVMEAFKLPKNTEREIADRKQFIQKAFEGAIIPPLTLMEATTELIDWNEFILKHGNRNAFSDAGVAFHLLKVAFEGGRMNVLINLGSLQNTSLKHTYLTRLSTLENSFNRKRWEVEKIIQRWINGTLDE